MAPHAVGSRCSHRHRPRQANGGPAQGAEHLHPAVDLAYLRCCFFMVLLVYHRLLHLLDCGTDVRSTRIHSFASRALQSIPKRQFPLPGPAARATATATMGPSASPSATRNGLAPALQSSESPSALTALSGYAQQDSSCWTGVSPSEAPVSKSVHHLYVAAVRSINAMNTVNNVKSKTIRHHYADDADRMVSNLNLS